MDDIKDDMKAIRNANVGTDRGRSLLAESLRDLGTGRSILVDRNGVVERSSWAGRWTS